MFQPLVNFDLKCSLVSRVTPREHLVEMVQYSTLSNEKAIDTIRLPGFALLLLLKPPLILTLHHHHHFTDALVSSHASLLISSHRYSFSGVRFIYSSPIKPFLFMLLSILLSRIATGEMFRSVPDLTARSVSVVAFSLLL
jgi:hypothetical protein